MSRRAVWVVSLISALIAPISAVGSSDLPKVFVGIEPLRGLVQSLAGPDYEVLTLLPVGASPATYEPQAKQLAALSRARVLFVVGVPFEEVLVRRLQQGSMLRETVSLAPPRGEALDPHAWLDPHTLIAMSEVCAQWFVTQRPESGDEIELRAREYARDMRAFDARVSAALVSVEDRAFATVHPAYGAFARRYGLQQIALESEGRIPSGKSLVETVEEIRRSGARVLLVQPQHSSRQAETVARQLGLTLIEVDPLAPDPVACMMGLVDAIAPVPGGEDSRWP